MIAECEPYSASGFALDKALMDVGISPDVAYSTASSMIITKAAVEVLSKMLSVTSESEGGYSQSYSPQGLKARIKQLCAASGLDVSLYVNTNTLKDGSSMW